MDKTCECGQPVKPGGDYLCADCFNKLRAEIARDLAEQIRKDEAQWGEEGVPQ